MGRSPRPAPSCQLSPLLLLKCGLTAPKIVKISIFWCRFAQKGYTPLHDFYKIWLGDGVPGPHPRARLAGTPSVSRAI